MTEPHSSRWPAIPVAAWQDTRDTLHLYSQIVGKIRLANEPLVNHWWNSTLYVTARGLTTSLMPHPTGAAFQIDFDFLDHRLDIATVDGARRSLRLEDRSVAEFHDAVMSMLDQLGLATPIWPVPVEIPGAVPFADDRTHARYDPDAVHRFWLVLPDGARWDDDLAEFILPYELVRTADDPDAVLLSFLQSTYDAAATSARWDRGALERTTEPDVR